MASLIKSRMRGFSVVMTTPTITTAMANSNNTNHSRMSLYPSLAPSAPVIDEHAQKTLVCYIPSNISDERKIITCTRINGGSKLVYLTDPRAAVLKSGSIIDSVEFFGFNNFTTKDSFSIGLGQMNNDISFPLVIDTTADIANERVGGCIDFISMCHDGKNMKNIVLYDSCVNVDLNEPVTAGGLQIVIRYHSKYI